MADVRYSSSVSGAENSRRASSIVWTASWDISRWSKRNGWTVADALIPVTYTATHEYESSMGNYSKPQAVLFQDSLYKIYGT